MIHFLRYGKGATPLGRIYNIHSEVSRLVLGAFPNENIQVDQSIKINLFFYWMPVRIISVGMKWNKLEF